jgi:hypothetical protein
MKRIILTLIFPLIVLILSSNPASASLFLCEKTDAESGNLVRPDSPQYDRLEYDNPLVYILQEISQIVILGTFLIGILGAIYATIRDATYSGEGDQDPAKYIRMRSGLIIAGVFIPLILLFSSYVIEFVTTYETTCFIKLPI